MKTNKTLTGIKFKYEGSVDEGLVIHKNIPIWIPKNIINAIKEEVLRRSPILMGACRDNPSKNSIGESLREKGYSSSS